MIVLLDQQYTVNEMIRTVEFGTVNWLYGSSFDLKLTNIIGKITKYLKYLNDKLNYKINIPF